MTSYKLYKPLFLSLSLALAGCGGGGDDETPEVTALSVVNPIPDQTATVDTLFSFDLPTDICSAAAGEDITLQVTQASLVAGLSILGGDKVFGSPDEPGVASITITCSTETESVTDEFTITVSDKIANPTVEVNAPNTAKEGTTVTLNAIAEDGNITGSIVSYAWEQTSGIAVTLTNADSAEVTFTAPDNITTQSSLKFSVTVTDNDGATDTDSVEIDLISAFAPDVSLSFPLALGVYSADTIDMFGNVEAASGSTLDSVIVFVDGLEHEATVTNSTWRVEDATITDNSEIKVVATSADGFINYEEIMLIKTLYDTSIDDSISDIAVSESTGDIYVSSEGTSVEFKHFNINTFENSDITFTRAADFAHLGQAPTSITLDTSSNDLLVSYQNGVSKIDLETYQETEVSNENLGGGDTPELILDIFYDVNNDLLYVADFNNKTISNVDLDDGERTVIETSTNGILSVAVASISDDIYYSEGASTSNNVLIDKFDGTTTTNVYDSDDESNGGSPVSDLAINEADGEMFIVNGNGHLMKLDSINNTETIVIENLFSVESVSNSLTPLIGLHYDSTRNVVIAAGRDADGTNKLLVIDPVSGDYAKVATGTVD
ncbi:putative Ig domain-containing protein [uncultured Psychrosphaera sp.]|uniref:PKD domain-containing protein n=1 Tax=uncultured Psychrosphaera sp. TaxID=1403522 RepID=UPI0026166CB0|nr:putative Ig domain-containing protein [uncultured Psychrosphaera sp.]